MAGGIGRQPHSVQRWECEGEGFAVVMDRLLAAATAH